MKKILLIGNGAREQVIAETLLKGNSEDDNNFGKNKGSVELYVVGGSKNPGIYKLAKEYLVADVCDLKAIEEFAKKIQPDFAVSGPEAPFAAGVVDMLAELGIPSASPNQNTGRLETSKGFTRDLLEKYQIPGNPKFKVFKKSKNNKQEIEDFLESLDPYYVVKDDGLKGGKGVKVAGDHLHSVEEALEFAMEALEDSGQVVIEEKLVGQEFSLMCFCDGKNIAAMPAVQDHKRAYEGDKGPNTGGMGTYSDANHSLPFLENSDIQEALEITKKVAEAIYQETGEYFKGVMYGGFFATKNGSKLIEYNARFGDPEAMNVLPLLQTDLAEIFQAIIEGNLDSLEIKFTKKATVCKYVVPEGYPENSVKGEIVKIEDSQGYEDSKNFETNSESKISKNSEFYFASIDEKDGELYLCGSRAIACLGIGDTIREAEENAQKLVESIKGPVFYRKDIGTQAVIDQKVKFMKDLRGLK